MKIRFAAFSLVATLAGCLAATVALQDGPREQAERLIDAVRGVKEQVTYCSVCSNITDIDPCGYCRDDARDHHVICVVEEPQNVASIEKTRQ